MWWEEWWVVRCKVFTVTRASAWMLVGIYRDAVKKKITVQKATEKCTHFSLVINLCFHPLTWLYQLCYYHLVIHILTITERSWGQKKNKYKKYFSNMDEDFFFLLRCNFTGRGTFNVSCPVKAIIQKAQFGGEKKLEPSKWAKILIPLFFFFRTTHRMWQQLLFG